MNTSLLPWLGSANRRDRRQRLGNSLKAASTRFALGSVARSGLLVTLVVCGAGWLPIESLAQSVPSASACGAVQRGTDSGGPYDYRSGHPAIKTVETFHFTPEVEALIRGKSNALIIGDLEFVFRHVPNHHRALMSLVRLAEREKLPQPRGATYSVACHFERALQFRPDDALVRMLYAQYLLKSGQTEGGLQHLEMVKKDRASDAISQYNVGLIYFEAGLYPQALEQAHLAQQLGFPRLDLKERLVAKGQWQEPADRAPK